MAFAKFSRKKGGAFTPILAPKGNPPVCTVKPVIAGSPLVGNILTTTLGTWTQTPTQYYIQWQRDNVDIPGAIFSNYTVQNADLGHTIKTVVSAWNLDGPGIAFSNLLTAGFIAAPTFTPGLALGENMINPDYWGGVQTFIDIAFGGGSDIDSTPSNKMVPFANRDANGIPTSFPGTDTGFRFFLQAPYISVPYVLQWTGSPVGSPNLHNGVGAAPGVDYSQLASNKITFTPAANTNYFLEYTNGATPPSNWTCRPQTDPGGTIESHLTTNMAQITTPSSFTRFIKWTSVETRNNSPKQQSGAGAAISSITNGAGTSTTATVTTTTAHGLSGQGNGTGQQASIVTTGVTPARYNQTNVLLTVIAPNQFQYQTLSGIDITSITASGTTTATLTTISPHGLSTGAIVSVIGASFPFAVQDVAITVTTTTAFTYTMLNSTSGSPSALGVYAVAASGNATVVGSFTYGDTNFQFWNLKYPNPATEPGTQLNEPIYSSTKRNLNPNDCEYQDGVKVETIITVASALSNNPWFDVPWNADDTFYTAVANLWATFAVNHPTKKVAIAHSNEVWNSGYTVSHQAANEANFRGTQSDASVLPSVRLVATSNVALSGLATIDGFTPSAGDRVLCPAQTTATQNGVYIAAAGAWSRATDVIASLSKWFVTTGLVNAQTTWFVQNSGAITLGTTALVIPQFINLHRYVEKTIAVMQIFETAFAAQGVSAQLVRTFAWQNASSPNNWDTVAAYPNALAHCDAFAVAPYYGNTSTGADVPTIAASIASDIGAVTDQAKGHYTKALLYGKNLTMYEGGVNGFISDHTLMAAYVASTQCYDNELAWLQQLELKCPTIAGTIFTSINHFAYSYPIGNDSNQWGTLSAGDQSPSVAQKGKAHIDFIAGKRVLADPTGTLSTADTTMAIGTSLGALTPSAYGVVWSMPVNDSGNFTINATTGVVTTAASLSGVPLGNRSITVRQTNPADGSFRDTAKTIVLAPPLLIDNFNGGSLDASKWTIDVTMLSASGVSATSVTASVASSEFQINFQTGAGGHGNAIKSVSTIDLTQTPKHFVKFTTNGDNGHNRGLCFGTPGGLVCHLQRHDNSLWLKTYNNDTGTVMNGGLAEVGAVPISTFPWARLRYEVSDDTLRVDLAPSTASNPPLEADWAQQFSTPRGTLPLTGKIGLGGWEDFGTGIGVILGFDGFNTAI